jgi:CheY-like chemotaxis protein/anti-sigma regulatory factor (Ser/Thr protein kinase)
MRSAPENGIILLVDDEPTSLFMLRVLVERAQLPCLVARNGEEAIATLSARSPSAFDAVLTDFLMPGISGIELVERIRDLDPSLATLIITSDSERETLSSSFRSGAVDFIEKPVSRQSLLAALVRATAHTRQQRHLRSAAGRLAAVTAIQDRLAPRLAAPGAITTALDCELATRICPIHEAGGDFVSAVRTDEGTVHLVLGDVSGHGLLEGFIASYFQGFVKGMQTLGAAPDRIADACNRFLLNEWAPSPGDLMPSSLSAVFLSLDLRQPCLSVYNYGCPPVHWVHPSGRLHTLSAQSTPLGWFDTLTAGHDRLVPPDFGCCYIWSDGLDDQAREVGVSPVAFCARLLLAPPHLASEALGDLQAHDDILVARLRWFPAGAPSEAWLPLFFAEIPGSGASSIDELQERFERELAYALSRPAETLTTVSLCMREAVLNALLHGCGGRADLAAHLSARFLPDLDRIEVRVSDPGPGFTPAAPSGDIDFGNGEAHISLGINVMRKLSRCVRHERGGADCILEFDLPHL